MGKSDRNISFTKPYLITAATVFVMAITITIVMFISANFYQKMLLLGLVGSTIGTLTSLVFNLCYFLPLKMFEVRLLMPGLLFLILIVLTGPQDADLVFMLTIGLTNSSMGLFWYLKLRKGH